MRCKIII